jgi:hypothetical protein
MTMISVDSVHEILAMNGALPEEFTGYLMDSDGDSCLAGLSTLSNFSLVFTSEFVYTVRIQTR